MPALKDKGNADLQVDRSREKHTRRIYIAGIGAKGLKNPSDSSNIGLVMGYILSNGS
jgi:hypothetical protein